MATDNSITGKLAALNLFNRFWKRALIFSIPIAVFAILSAYPEKFRAEATLTPADPATLGLSETLGQLGAISSVFGKQADVEVALRIGTSIYTRDTVISRLGLEERVGEDGVDLHRWLEDELVMRSLRGGIILIQMDHTDQELAQDIVGAFTEATRDELAEITIRQTEYKREVLQKLVDDSSQRLSEAQSKFDTFRLENGYANPTRSIEIISEKVPTLRAALEEKDRQLVIAGQLFTPENITIIQLRAERDRIAEELTQALSSQPRSEQQGTVGEVVSVSTRLFELERELNLAQSLYTNYLRYLQGTTVEELTSTANIRMLERPYVSTERQYRWSLITLAIALFLIWMAIEFYRLRPPLGAPINGNAKPEDRGVKPQETAA